MEQPTGADVEGFGSSFAEELEELASEIDEAEGEGNGDGSRRARRRRGREGRVGLPPAAWCGLTQIN